MKYTKLILLTLSTGLLYQTTAWSGITQKDIDDFYVQSEVYEQDNGSYYVPNASGTDWVFSADGKTRFDCTENRKGCIDLLGSEDGNLPPKGDDSTPDDGKTGGGETTEKPKKKWWKKKNKGGDEQKSTSDNGSESNPLQALRDTHSSNPTLETKIKRVKTGNNQGSSGTADEVKASAKAGPATSSSVIEYQDGDDVKLQRSEPAGYVDKSTCDQACRSAGNSAGAKPTGQKMGKKAPNTKMKKIAPRKLQSKK
jgi:hypothetical protein